MKFQSKLCLSFILAGVLPVLLMGYIAWQISVNGLQDVGEKGQLSLDNKVQDKLVTIRDMKKRQIEQYFVNREHDMEVLVQSVDALRNAAFRKLTAVREIKRTAIESYFSNIENQILTFSENEMVIKASIDFNKAFNNYQKEQNYSSGDMAKMRQSLMTYYNDDFANKYKKETGKNIKIDDYFNGLDDTSIALQYHYIKDNVNPLGDKHKLDYANDRSSYSKIHKRVHPVIRNYLEKFGYYDIFLLDPESGDIIYSVFKELDYSTSLIDGPYANTNFAEAFKAANKLQTKDKVVLVDYKRYTPSYEAPASFIASPVYDGDKKVAIAIFQMPIDRLNKIMGERAGLGETGETYLIGQDLLMRCDSYLDPKNHSVAASFANPEKGKIDTEAGNAALSGQTDTKVIIDYNGNPVLSAYCPVKVGNETWALLAEIDMAEAYCPKFKDQKDFYTQYKERYGYDDLFLVNADGYCFYSVEREADFQTNLVTGKYRESNFGQLIQTVKTNLQFGFIDFKPYAPRNDYPAAFIAQPIIKNDKLEVIVALKLPLQKINQIMSDRTGLCETGEAILVGPDNLMRSNSHRSPRTHSVTASFKNQETGRVDTKATKDVLENGATNVLADMEGYMGTKVRIAYTPVNVFGTTWCLSTKMDESEITKPVLAMAQRSKEANQSILKWMVCSLIVAFFICF